MKQKLFIVLAIVIFFPITNMAQVTSYPWTEGFENGGAIPSGWSNVYVTETTDWLYQSGDGDGHPANAKTGSYNASFGNYNLWGEETTKLVTEKLDLTGLENPQLTFWHTQEFWSPDQNQLRVYYSTTTATGPWTLIPGQVYTTNIPSWTEEANIVLPEPSATYYIAFEGHAVWGYGVCLDDIEVFDNTHYWTGGANTTDWATGTNWSLGTEPTSGDDVIIPGGSLSYYPTINETAVCNYLVIQDGGYLGVSSGSLTVSSYMSVGGGTDGEFQLDDGTVTITNSFYTDAGCTIDINGGTLDINGEWDQEAFGSGNAKGIIELFGGVIDVAGDCMFDIDGVSGTMDGAFTMTVGGFLYINSSDWGTPTGGGTIILTSSWYGSYAYAYSAASNDVIAYNLEINAPGKTVYIASDASEANQGVHVYGNLTVTAGTLHTYDESNHCDNFDVDGTFSMASNVTFINAIEDDDIYSVGSHTLNATSIYEYGGIGTQTMNYTLAYGRLDISTSALADINNTLNTQDHLYILNGGTMTLTAGANVTVGNNSNEDLDIIGGGKLIVNAGTLTVKDNMYVSYLGDNGEFEQNGGTVNLGADLRSLVNSIIDINGGALNIGEDWEREEGDPAYGTIELSGGNITVTRRCEFAETNVNGTMDGAFELNTGNIFNISDNGWSTVINGTVKIDGGSITSHVDHNAIAYNLIIDGTVEQNADAVINNDLTINSGGILNVNVDKGLTVNGTLTNNGGTAGLVVKSDVNGSGSIICSGTPNATVNRYLPDGSWHLVSPSTTGVTANDFYWNDAPQSWLLWHNEAETGDAAWNYNTNLSTAMPVGQGWMVWLDANTKSTATASMTGNLRTTDLTQSLDFTDASPHGFTLVGNPFSSAIDLGDGTGWTFTNIDLTIYIWNNASDNYKYQTTASGGDMANGIIPVGQGFFVHANASSPSLTIPASARTHNTQAFYKDQGKVSGYESYITIKATQPDIGADEVWISFADNGSDGFENGWDARKMFGGIEAPQLYMNQGERKLSINHLQTLDENERLVSMSFVAGIAGQQIFTANLNTLPDTEVILEDTKTGQLHSFNDNLNYTFTGSKQDDPNRFVLHFQYSPNGIDTPEVTDNNVHIYAYDNSVYVRTKDGAKTDGGTIIIYDVYGRIITQQQLEASDLVRIPLNTAQNFVIVRVVKNNQIYTSKVFIK